MNYYKEYWYEEDCQDCCGYYFVYYVCIDGVLCIGVGVGVDNQWYYFEDECQRCYQDWMQMYMYCFKCCFNQFFVFFFYQVFGEFND